MARLDQGSPDDTAGEERKQVGGNTIVIKPAKHLMTAGGYPYTATVNKNTTKRSTLSRAEYDTLMKHLGSHLLKRIAPTLENSRCGYSYSHRLDYLTSKGQQVLKLHLPLHCDPPT